MKDIFFFRDADPNMVDSTLLAWTRTNPFCLFFYYTIDVKKIKNIFPIFKISISDCDIREREILEYHLF